MSIAEKLARELEFEIVSTRKVLSRIPAELFDWKPQEKSFTFGQLASHVVNLVGWLEATLDLPEMTMTDDYKPWQGKSADELVAALDRHFATAQAKLAGYPDEQMSHLWSLKGADGQVYFSMPRDSVLRSFVFSHLVHHRGQLSVYLRLNQIPVPSIYGPSADEAQ